jgi:hypothetical protein
MTKNVAFPFPRTVALTTGRSGIPPVTALSVEFVAKPQEAHRVEATIPAAIADALKDVAGFAGCLVMISDQEARLVTVVTLWAGDDRVKRCGQNVRWVRALLTPYVDRCLRVQTMVAHVPLSSFLPLLPAIRQERIATAEGSVIEELTPEDETVCVG